MKKLQKIRRFLAVAMLSFVLFQMSAQNAVAIGSYHNAPTSAFSGTAKEQDMMIAPWTVAALAAAGLVAGAIAAYELGTIVGHAAHDAFGVMQPTFVAYESLDYVADDFSQFDTSKQN